MKQNRNLPNIDHLSVITAMILLAYASTAFIHFATRSINLQFPAFLFTLRFNFLTIISLVVGILAAVGANWLIGAHPAVGPSRHFHHWLIPAFTALVISVPLNSLQVNLSWWAVLALGGLLLTGVLITEYISVDLDDMRYPIARVSLTAMSFGLFLVLLVTMRATGVRLYAVLAAVLPASMVVTAKTLHLRLGGWNLPWTVGIGLVVAQLAAGCFYLPLRPLQFGLILVGVTYALVNLAGSVEDRRPTGSLWLEPGLILGLFILVAALTTQ